MRTKSTLLTAVSLCIANWGLAQYPVGPDQYELLGVLKGKPASEIKSSTWSIGGETLDRDYADYHSYSKYLGDLGAKRIRLQAGWAKCERVKGQYNFTWLDEIIDDALSRGVRPWVEFSYGNPIYEGGGEPKLGGALPTSEEALKAWDAWVTALVTRNKNKVIEWEVWNEPDLTPKITGKAYADFYIRTAELVRKIQPDARLLALGYAGVSRVNFLTEFFDVLKAQGKLDLVDVVTFHGYPPNPDDLYPTIENLKKVVHGYASRIKLMQGENGCPSTPSSNSVGALRQLDWTELSQAKYVARRLMGDYGRGIETNLFTLSDLHYQQGDHFSGVNSKGLLKTHEDKTIDRPKISYFSAQRIMGYFNLDEVSRLEPDALSVETTPKSVSAFGYRHLATGSPVYVFWNHEKRPAESFPPMMEDIRIDDKINNPVYVDLISGNVFAIPATAIETVDGKRTIKNIPIPDYPILVADQSAIPYQECR
ncbi:GH39 family glycosyl hydrolase [Parapedobacter indicus]|uniref:Glycosyl hydrolases family 39 n=1 Tax=Parapedobacter indicus TaxID=1477437 RepID=A0A1I3HIR2_9SPHI|nr:hypothetical protein [Parapedobacter indicus]PPL03055.1 glycosyl hydrolase family 39 [Parapedobacter indicus]SFI35572.1 Glycosyl hydrolases family 39 [Parapedobacter indicus]